MQQLYEQRKQEYNEMLAQVESDVAYSSKCWFMTNHR